MSIFAVNFSFFIFPFPFFQLPWPFFPAGESYFSTCVPHMGSTILKSAAGSLNQYPICHQQAKWQWTGFTTEGKGQRDETLHYYTTKRRIYEKEDKPAAASCIQ